jgi:hypothetical protein
VGNCTQARTLQILQQIAEAEGFPLVGHPDFQSLCQALVDWSAESRIIEQEICANIKI